jgi:hypothetical protein
MKGIVEGRHNASPRAAANRADVAGENLQARQRLPTIKGLGKELAHNGNHLNS